MQCGNHTAGLAGRPCMEPLITRRSSDLGVLHLCPVCDGPAANPTQTNPRNNRPRPEEAAAS